MEDVRSNVTQEGPLKGLLPGVLGFLVRAAIWVAYYYWKLRTGTPSQRVAQVILLLTSAEKAMRTPPAATPMAESIARIRTRLMEAQQNPYKYGPLIEVLSVRLAYLNAISKGGYTCERDYREELLRVVAEERQHDRDVSLFY